MDNLAMESDETRVQPQNVDLESSSSPAYSKGDNVNVEEGPPHNFTLDAPPSYESLYGRVKAAKQESTNVCIFVIQFLAIIFSTIGCAIIVGILMAIPISMIVIGALYLDDCPVERMIPIYLIVAGCFGCAKCLFTLVSQARRWKKIGKKSTPLKRCVYIYRIYDEVSYDHLNTDHYCDKTLYLFAFWVATAVYIIMGLFCFCVSYVRCLTYKCEAIG
ncbi:transmembrane protein 272-like [Physella acuta]|uniref:transmembrane protein 272-like n=1 Tax=Physella acuta TaxID=109671 RepID=UPI0027DC42E3|nr:transmembrane protein 272-like [Physella acuta]